MANVSKTQIAVWWVKRDFRLADNAALCRALTECDQVIPLYVFEPLVLGGPDWGVVHTQAVHDGATSLRKNLEHYGSTLVVRQGSFLSELEALYREHPFCAVYAHEETGLSHTYERDKAVTLWCKKHNIKFIEVPTNGVVRGCKKRPDRHSLFQVEMDAPLLPIPKTQLQTSLPASVRKGRIPALSVFGIQKNNQLWTVSERVARDTVREFLQTRAHGYSGGISSMNTAPTACSRLSVHLAWGTISLATVLHLTYARLQILQPETDDSSVRLKKSLRKFVSRLHWHSHFVQKLEDQVEMELHPINLAFATGLPYVSGHELETRLLAWKEGKTGFPMIDAAMRYYKIHGWLNFRSRAAITSFATHALRIPWQVVVYELAKYMHDYVPGIHVPQVQMQAGVTGINTIRVYSPQKQLEDHDPNCYFVKKWVLELQTSSVEEILNHHAQPIAGYSKPVIDFKVETKIMKDALYEKKKSPAGRVHAKKIVAGLKKRRN